MAIEKIAGKDLRVFARIGNATAAEVEIACATDFTLNIDVTMLEGVCRGDGSWGSRRPSTKNWSLDVDGFIAYTAAFNVEEIFDAVANGSKIYVRFTTNTTGDIQFEGSGYISTTSQTAPQEDFGTYNFTLMGDGELTKSTV
jgi:hypothetical protein